MVIEAICLSVCVIYNFVFLTTWGKKINCEKLKGFIQSHSLISLKTLSF